MISKLLKMQLLEDDDDEFAYLAPSDGEKQKREADGRPVWMRTLANSLANWLKVIPKVRRSTSRFIISHSSISCFRFKFYCCSMSVLNKKLTHGYLSIRICSCVLLGAIQVSRNAFFWKVGTHPPPRYTNIFFSGTLTPPLRCVTVGWPLIYSNNCCIIVHVNAFWWD